MTRLTPRCRARVTGPHCYLSWATFRPECPRRGADLRVLRSRRLKLHTKSELRGVLSVSDADPGARDLATRGIGRPELGLLRRDIPRVDHGRTQPPRAGATPHRRDPRSRPDRTPPPPIHCLLVDVHWVRVGALWLAGLGALPAAISHAPQSSAASTSLLASSAGRVNMTS